MNKKRNFLCIVMFLIIFSMFSFVNAKVNMSDPLEFQRYQKVIDEFEKGKKAVVDGGSC